MRDLSSGSVEPSQGGRFTGVEIEQFHIVDHDGMVEGENKGSARRIVIWVRAIVFVFVVIIFIFIFIIVFISVRPVVFISVRLIFVVIRVFTILRKDENIHQIVFVGCQTGCSCASDTWSTEGSIGRTEIAILGVGCR